MKNTTPLFGALNIMAPATMIMMMMSQRMGLS